MPTTSIYIHTESGERMGALMQMNELRFDAQLRKMLDAPWLSPDGYRLAAVKSGSRGKNRSVNLAEANILRLEHIASTLRVSRSRAIAILIASIYLRDWREPVRDRAAENANLARALREANDPAVQRQVARDYWALEQAKLDAKRAANRRYQAAYRQRKAK